VALAVAGSTATVLAQRRTPEGTDAVEAERAIVFELGAAGDWSRAEGFHPGGTFAFEITPIEHWLELEVGVTALWSDGSTEMPVDVLVKKPWQLSRNVEFMVGVGPELVFATGSNAATFWGIEAVADLMVWPRRNVGWYIEPGYETTMRDGVRRHGLGIAVGLLLGR
jgi:hypothetical protein